MRRDGNMRDKGSPELTYTRIPPSWHYGGGDTGRTKRGEAPESGVRPYQTQEGTKCALTNEMAGTGRGPKVDSAEVKFQVYLSHSGMQKPKMGEA